MHEKLNLIGALAAHVIFVSSIITFSFRKIFKLAPGNWVGIPILLMVFPLAYLLVTAPGEGRPFLYYIQVGLMLLWLILLFLVDYVLHYDFRQTQWMVIAYVVIYFAGMGGMIGVASLAGRAWTVSSIVFFVIAAILAFAQRALVQRAFVPTPDKAPMGCVSVEAHFFRVPHSARDAASLAYD